jgi:DNA polymerase III sliding clamp (beta) subunit (PCNA family)
MKNITLPANELKTAVAGLNKIISKRTTLPVIGFVRIERVQAGGITISATDLDAFASYQFENASEGEPESVLVPFASLNTILKGAGPDETIAFEKLDANQVGIRYSIAGQAAQQRVASLPSEEWPPMPSVTGEPILFDGALRAALLEAIQCTSADESRYVLQGACIDVSGKQGHCIVGTDGRHLYSFNSFKIPLKDSVIVPAHRFLAWKPFAQDGDWTLRVGGKAAESNWIQFQSFRWSFAAKAIEGQFPNWRQVLPNPKDFKTTIRLQPTATAELINLIGKLPAEGPNYALGIKTHGGKLTLSGQATEVDEPTQVQFEHAETTGEPATVSLNRNYLLKALRFGLNEIQIQDGMSPVRCIDQAGRQIIIMPVRPAVVSSGPQPTNSPLPQPVEANTTSERKNKVGNTTQNANVTRNGNGAGTQETTQSSLEVALDHIEQVKGSIRSATSGLGVLAGILKQAQREQRGTEKEVQSVRSTLQSLQRVKI